METIHLTLSKATRSGRFDRAYLGGLVSEALIVKWDDGEAVPKGTQVGLYLGETLCAAAETDETGTATLNTDTQELAEAFEGLPVDYALAFTLFVGDDDNILAIVPARVKKNWLDDTAVHPPVPIPAYWTKEQTRAAIDEAIADHNADGEAHADIRKAIDTHADRADNPHRVTAEQAGALAKTGCNQLTAPVRLIRKDGSANPVLLIGSQLNGEGMKEDGWTLALHFDRLVFRTTPGGEVHTLLFNRPGDDKAGSDAIVLWKELNAAIENIELTPGPQGPQGETGPQGPKGDPGEDATVAIDTTMPEAPTDDHVPSTQLLKEELAKKLSLTGGTLTGQLVLPSVRLTSTNPAYTFTYAQVPARDTAVAPPVYGFFATRNTGKPSTSSERQAFGISPGSQVTRLSFLYGNNVTVGDQKTLFGYAFRIGRQFILNDVWFSSSVDPNQATWWGLVQDGDELRIVKDKGTPKAYLPLSGGTVTGSVRFEGTDNYMARLHFGGSAKDAGLMTKGICGTNADGKTKSDLFLNYDGRDVPTEEYFRAGANRGVYICGGLDKANHTCLVLRKQDGDYFYAPKAQTYTKAEVDEKISSALAGYLKLASTTEQSVNGNVRINGRLYVSELFSGGAAQFFQVVSSTGFNLLNINKLIAWGNKTFMENRTDGVYLTAKSITEDGTALVNKYALKDHTHDGVYAAKAETYTKAEVDTKISEALGNIQTALAAI